MREILFRGKSFYNGKWVEGFIAASRENTYPNGFEMITVDGINYDELDGYIPHFTSYAVDPSTIGQYTGLKDKNGKKIFEGDVVWFSDEKERGVVCFDEIDACFAVRFDTFDAAFDHLYSNGLEIIGNVFDNPELMEGGE